MTEVIPGARRWYPRVALVTVAAAVAATVLAVTAAPAEAATDGFNADPVRLIDTRTASPDRPAGPVTGFVQTQLPDSVADGNGALLSVTVVNPTSNGSITAYPDGGAVPATSDVNFIAGPTIAQSVVVPAAAGATGKIDFLIATTGAPVDLVVDVIGAFPSATYTGLGTAVRALDSRSGTGIAQGRVGTGVYPLTLPAGIPSSAQSVAITVTQVNGTGIGYVSALSTSTPSGTSSLNYTATSVNSNLVFVKPTARQIFLQVQGASTDLIVDVKGYTASSAVTAISPVRALDTRSAANGGLVGTGIVNVPVPADAPAGASFALLNVTSTQAAQVGYLASLQAADGETQTSSLNWAPGQDVAGFVVAPIVSGQAQVYIGAGQTKLVADVEGYVVNAG